MSTQYPGGLITKTPVTPSGPYETSTASGVWTLDEQAYWQKLGQWPTPGRAEPDLQFNYVTMLLHGDGVNGGQNNTFLDSSTNNFTITRNGDTFQGSSSPYGSNWSNYFDSSGTYFTLGTNSAYNFSTGSWTYECWVNLSGTSTSAYYTVFANGWPIQVYVRNNVFELYVGTLNTSGGNFINGQTTSANSVPVGSWVHFALVRNSANDTYKMYVNGVEQASTTSATNPIASTDNFSIGAFGPNPTSGTVIRFLGYISNFRATASAVYTSNFTPSTTPLTAISGTGLLTCQSNRFIDNSTNNFALTVNGTPIAQRFSPFGASTAYSTSVIGGSGYFSASYLTAPSNSAFAMGTGDFTIECWINTPVVSGSNDVIIELRSSGGTSTGFVFNMNPTGIGYQLNFYTDGGFNLGSTVLNYNVWNHCAVTRSGTTVRLFSNGVVSATFTKANNFSDTPIPNIGRSPLYSPSNLNGYMTDLRVVKGTALYTSAFTPPTAPLTAVSGTSLLLNYTDGAIFDNAMIADIRTVNDAQISTSVVKYGTGSLAFDGTNDYLISYFPDKSLYSFGTGDFTIEMWVYTSNLSNYQTLIDTRASNTLIPYGLFIDDTGKPYWFDASDAQVSSTAISSNTWTHLAVARSGSTLKIFLSGTQVFSGTNTNAQNPTGVFYVGRNFGNTAVYSGYIDDLRITKGYARYTANFTPPTAAFPNIGPT